MWPVEFYLTTSVFYQHMGDTIDDLLAWIEADDKQAAGNPAHTVVSTPARKLPRHFGGIVALPALQLPMTPMYSRNAAEADELCAEYVHRAGARVGMDVRPVRSEPLLALMR